MTRRQVAQVEVTRVRRICLAVEPTRPTDDEWRNDAACQDTDPSLFFARSRPGRAPTGGPTGDELDDTHAARLVCATCPVRSECLGDALTWREKYGIRGGQTATERRRWSGKWAWFVCHRCAKVSRLDRAGSNQLLCAPCKHEAHLESTREWNLRNSTTDPWWNADDMAAMTSRLRRARDEAAS